MSIHETIKGQLKEAMLAKQTVRLGVIRGLLAAFTNEMIAKKMTGDFMPDDEALVVIKRLVKQRKDSIEQFTKGGRSDLAEAEKAELAVLETYLPKMMSKDEILKIAEAKKKDMNVTDKSKLGQFIGAVMKETKGMADGAVVKEVVESLF